MDWLEGVGMALDARVVRFCEMNDLLTERVPEVRDAIDAVLRLWAPDKPGQHVLYGDVLTPYLERLLTTGENDERLRELFDFLEELSANEDVRVQEVVSCTILEHLLGWRHDVIGRARAVMGPATLASSREIEDGWRAVDRKRSEAGGVDPV
jgi:hypothetical protein